MISCTDVNYKEYIKMYLDSIANNTEILPDINSVEFPSSVNDESVVDDIKDIIDYVMDNMTSMDDIHTYIKKITSMFAKDIYDNPEDSYNPNNTLEDMVYKMKCSVSYIMDQCTSNNISDITMRNATRAFSSIIYNNPNLLYKDSSI